MRARGRAITLIELLIVLAVALALGAVSLRGALTWSEGDQLRAATDAIASAALEARAEAIAFGTSVELVATVRAGDAVAVGMVQLEAAPGDESPGSEDFGAASEEPNAIVLYELPEGLRIERAEGEEPEGKQPIRLVRLLPDGSAVLAEGTWYLSRGDERFVPTVERWTARLALSPLMSDDTSLIGEVLGEAGEGEP